MNAVVRAQLTFQMLTLLQRYFFMYHLLGDIYCSLHLQSRQIYPGNCAVFCLLCIVTWVWFCLYISRLLVVFVTLEHLSYCSNIDGRGLETRMNISKRGEMEREGGGRGRRRTIYIYRERGVCVCGGGGGGGGCSFLLVKVNIAISPTCMWLHLFPKGGGCFCLLVKVNIAISPTYMWLHLFPKDTDSVYEYFICILMAVNSIR